MVRFAPRTENPKGSIARSRVEEFTFLDATMIYLDIPGEITKIELQIEIYFRQCEVGLILQSIP